MTKKQLNVRLPSHVIKKIEETCESRGISQAQLIEELLDPELRSKAEKKLDEIYKILKKQ